MNGIEGNEYGFAADHAGTQDGRVLTEAIFALAYEQRTANLIAFLDGANTPRAAGEGPRELYYMIVKRLGLCEEEAL